MLISSSLKRLIGSRRLGWLPADNRQNSPVKRLTSEVLEADGNPLNPFKTEGSIPNTRIQDILPLQLSMFSSQFFLAASSHP